MNENGNVIAIGEYHSASFTESISRGVTDVQHALMIFITFIKND